MYEQQFNPFAANVAIIKGYFKSGKVLAVGILYIVSAVLGILTALTTPASVYFEVLDSLEELGIDMASIYSTIYSTYETFSVSSVIAVLVSAGFSVLIAVSFIIIFMKSRNDSPDSTPIAGVTILHVLATIAFVYSIVLTVLFAVAYLIVVIAVTAFSYSYYDIAAVAMIIIGILFAIVMFLLIFTTAKRKTYYRSVKYSLTTVELQNKGAGAWGIISIIMAAGRGISLIDTLADTLTSYITAYSILTLLSLIVTFVIHILDASIALGYTKYINLQKSGYNNTPYGGAPNNAYAPAPNTQPVYRNQPDFQQPQPPYQNQSYQQNQPPVPYNDNFTENNAPAQEQRPSVCPKCGTQIDSSLPFCGNCGNKL